MTFVYVYGIRSITHPYIAAFIGFLTNEAQSENGFSAALHICNMTISATADSFDTTTGKQQPTWLYTCSIVNLIAIIPPFDLVGLRKKELNDG
jgi:hypothetical protein